MVLGGGGEGFCDDITKVLVIKRMTMGEGVKICPKLSDAIFFLSEIKSYLEQSKIS